MSDHPEDRGAFEDFAAGATEQAKISPALADVAFEDLVHEIYRRFDAVVILTRRNLEKDNFELRIRQNGSYTDAVALCVRGVNFFDRKTMEPDEEEN